MRTTPLCPSPRLPSLALLGVLALGGCGPSDPPPQEAATPSYREDAWVPPESGLFAHIFTNRGLIVAVLDMARTPMTVTSFVGLAEGTIENDAFDAGVPYYDGSPFHRVVPGHVIQGGAAISPRSPGPGYTFPNELHAELDHGRAGMLNMANGGPHTNSAQFTITLGDRSYLDGDYIAFGRVTEGLETVFAIGEGDVMDSVRIHRVGPEAEAFVADTRAFQRLREEALARVAHHDSVRARSYAEWVARRWPEAPPLSARAVVMAGDALGVEVGAGGRGTGLDSEPREVDVRYRGLQIRYRGAIEAHPGPVLEETPFVSREEGVPGFGASPTPFRFQPGSSWLNPALDDLIPLLPVGGTATVVVPASMGFGTSGLYPPEIPGEPRFIISPEALLIYEIEVLGETAR